MIKSKLIPSPGEPWEIMVKFVLRLIEEHNVSSAEVKTTVGTSSC